MTTPGQCLFLDSITRSVDDVITHLELLGKRVGLSLFDLEHDLLLLALVLVVKILLLEDVLAEEQAEHLERLDWQILCLETLL